MPKAATDKVAVAGKSIPRTSLHGRRETCALSCKVTHSSHLSERTERTYCRNGAFIAGAYRRPVIDAAPCHREAVELVLGRFGDGPCAVAERAGIRIVVLGSGERFDERSSALRRIGAGVDGWPVPPAGLFVVEERTMYLRSTTPMTVAHEFGHALDCALGGGVYLSSVDPRIRRAFARATAFVTPYAASACDEYFAEALRAWVGVNDSPSLWPRATRERLWALDPRVAEIVASLFANELSDPST